VAIRSDLWAEACRIRTHFRGDEVRCCSIVAAKVGRCSEDCAFCSQSGHFKTHVQGQSVVEPDAVLKAAEEAAANGADSFGIVNSGYGPSDDDIEHWGAVVGRIREGGKIRACASLGIVSREQAERLADLGLQRYNLNLQTSRRHFPKIVRTHSYDDRRRSLDHLRAAGVSVCSGGLFGMGETWGDRLDLAFDLREIDPDVVPLNFLIAIDGTPLADRKPMDPMECLDIVAIYRFLLPRQEIKIAGGREVNLGDHQDLIFAAGADSFLIGNYLTTCGRPAEKDHRMVREVGLKLTSYASTEAAKTNVHPPEHVPS
jgi:biotin synthase